MPTQAKSDTACMAAQARNLERTSRHICPADGYTGAPRHSSSKAWLCARLPRIFAGFGSQRAVKIKKIHYTCKLKFLKKAVSLFPRIHPSKERVKGKRERQEGIPARKGRVPVLGNYL